MEGWQKGWPQCVSLIYFNPLNRLGYCLYMLLNTALQYFIVLIILCMFNTFLI